MKDETVRMAGGRLFHARDAAMIATCAAKSGQTQAAGRSRGVYVLTSHCNFKIYVNVPHVNTTVTDFGGVYTDIHPVATPVRPSQVKNGCRGFLMTGTM